MMNIADIIDKKSKGIELTFEEIDHFVKQVYEKSIDEAQIGAFLMSVKLKGMTATETSNLTKTMGSYGESMSWRGEKYYHMIADKHSTGGVGDKISQILVPILAVFGVKVPMISGRGLGITGGTLDKLESIPGFNINLTLDEQRSMLDSVGCFIVGQTSEMAPTDKKLYSVRDITATVDSIPLITASILSKKYIEDLRYLVMDLKFGRATFMKTEEEARILGKSLIDTGKFLNLPTVCVLDRMDHPIGRTVGNALEMAEVFQALNGCMTDDLREIVFTLGCEILTGLSIFKTNGEARKNMEKALMSGSPLEVMKQMLIGQHVQSVVAAKLCDKNLHNLSYYLDILSGNGDIVKTDVLAKKSGFLVDQNALAVAKVCHSLGAGRTRLEDQIDYQVGVNLHKKINDLVNTGEVWATVYHRGKLSQHQIENMENSIEIADNRKEFKQIQDIMK